jgi:hypothetical protein
VIANKMPPKKVNTITKVFLKKRCANENTMAFMKIKKLVFIKRVRYRLKKNVRKINS